MNWSSEAYRNGIYREDIRTLLFIIKDYDSYVVVFPNYLEKDILHKNDHKQCNDSKIQKIS